MHVKDRRAETMIRRQLQRRAIRPWAQLFAGLLMSAVALAVWAMTWLLGARQVISDLLHREAAGISGFEMAAFALWAMGLVFLLGIGWSIGTEVRRSIKR